MATALVVENSPLWHLGNMKAWLTDTGLKLHIVKPHQKDPIPTSGCDAIIALGGGSDAEWSAELASVLTTAVARSTPTLTFCSSARLLAAQHGGLNEPVKTFAPGPRLLARRDIAIHDALFANAPMALDVVSWRREELTELPPEAELIASTPSGAPEIFRIGDRAWGIQSHIELDGAMITDLGGDTRLAERVDAITEHLDDTWQPIMERFATLAAGKTVGMPLPIIDKS